MDELKPSVKYLRNLFATWGGVDDPDSSGKTTMTCALALPDPQVVRLLLAAGADIHLRDKTGRQALHHIAGSSNSGVVAHSFRAHARIIQMLLAAGADLESKDYNGDTPLSLATRNGRTSAVLRRRKDINATSTDGYTLLCRAAWLGSPDTVRAILAAGADPNACGQHGVRPLHFAAELMKYSDGEMAIKALLGAGAELDAPDAYGCTPLWTSASKGSAPAVLALLKAGANAHIRGAFGCSSLHFAAMLMSHPKGRKAILALLRAGVDLNVTNDSGKTPLHVAAARGSPWTVRLLLQLGANSTIPAFFGVNLVLHAAKMMRYRDGTDAVSVLLKAGADVEVASKAGITLLTYGVFIESLPLIRMALAAGANVRISIFSFLFKLIKVMAFGLVAA
ncbi:hypothetical protein BOTBODRAFT_107396 [Botryobasidium botryosum FD-172 SS1]|uniref:Uncharacterized protein n=1 Tax=Botryobasidium botryosum (strain FD-172 SS1) TaxID=930990 RepID=A0A067MWN6_BOTB1|nr:hypothetical protein BOTBODRAFT_107396 [Botryobasidium botryosum FD-172 SS1]